MPNTTEVKIKCQDGFPLAGTLFEPPEAKAAIMIAPATGIKRTFYHSFAQFLAQNGYAVLTFDNRGIGGSIVGSINDGNPSLINWGKLDMTSVLSFLQKKYPQVAYHLVGHSAGGQLVGLMDNAMELTSMFNFGCSSGSIKNAKPSFKLFAHFWLNGVIPISNLLFGHTKSQWFGMGEPLPKVVAAQWRKWCNGRGYVKVDLGTAIQEHLYDEIDFPSIWLHALDDNIANLANVKDMIRVYSRIDSQIVGIHPQDYGFSDIGHMKFFSAKRKELWQYALQWFGKY